MLLCGSGSCLAGLFQTRPDAEAAAARLDLPGFRAVVEGPAGPVAQRRIVMPAASRSKVSAVTPCSRSGTFWMRSVGVFGSRSTKRM